MSKKKKKKPTPGEPTIATNRKARFLYEVIEKVVSREIDRLKGALLDNSGPGNDE